MASPANPVNNNSDLPLINSRTLHELETVRVQTALDEGRVELYFQPIIRSKSNGFVAFYEGLARIKMPNGAVISAGRFMPFVENSALGTKLDRRVLRLALQQLSDNPEIRLSINMSVASMNDAVWILILEAAPSELCARLIIEITEGTAMSDVDLTIAFMNRVRRKQCCFALDDFGTGATSFRYFKDFMFDFVKIDGLFIRDLSHDTGNQVLVKALSNICKHFDMMTVAEFVETDGEAAMAEKLGIDCLQGYLLGKPTTLPIAPQDTDRVDRKIAG